MLYIIIIIIMFVNDFSFLFFSSIVIGSVLILFVMFHSSRHSPIREDYLVRERGGREGEGREGGRGREEGEGEDEERVNDFSCSYRFSSSSFQETVKRGRRRSLTTQASSYTPQQDKR